jgi:hypothetical protein
MNQLGVFTDMKGEVRNKGAVGEEWNDKDGV